jgi:hypothetical protein
MRLPCCLCLSPALNFRAIWPIFLEVSFQVLTVTSMKMIALWDVATHRPDDGGSKRLWNVGQHLRDYTVLYPRILLSSIFMKFGMNVMPLKAMQTLHFLIFCSE